MQNTQNLLGDDYMGDELIFPSEEWVAKYKELLNANAAYEDAAKTWEGDFVFEVTDHKIRFYLDLWHGKCREARMAGPDGISLLL